MAGSGGGGDGDWAIPFCQEGVGEGGADGGAGVGVEELEEGGCAGANKHSVIR